MLFTAFIQKADLRLLAQAHNPSPGRRDAYRSVSCIPESFMEMSLKTAFESPVPVNGNRDTHIGPGLGEGVVAPSYSGPSDTRDPVATGTAAYR